jgi:DNA invertase Pin-like site-specific DNA recombinase
MAEFERSLTQERVRVGLRDAILKGKTLGRPRRIVNGDQLARLREQEARLRQIAKAVGASPGYGPDAPLVWIIKCHRLI